MAETTITGLPNANLPLSGAERIPMDQDGATVDASAADIAALATTSWGDIQGTVADQADLTPAAIGAPASDPSGVAGAMAVANIVVLTQVDYDGLPVKDASTLYFVIEP